MWFLNLFDLIDLVKKANQYLNVLGIGGLLNRVTLIGLMLKREVDSSLIPSLDS